MRKAFSHDSTPYAVIQFADSRDEETGHRAGFFVSKSPNFCNEAKE